jgi:hydroxyacylglutathione hydrolase
MTIKVWVFSTGQLSNNVVFLMDEDSKETFVIDPSYEPEILLDFIEVQGLLVTKILLTHGHFDHFAGVSYLNSRLPERPQLGIHRDDLELLREGGGSKEFHMAIPSPGNPDFYLEDGQELLLGEAKIQVRLAPGHTPGSVIFYLPDSKAAICGDLIFYHGVGRTDLAGGSQQTLISSIQNQIFTLSPETRLIPGHGEETTVLEEMKNNPFVSI